MLLISMTQVAHGSYLYSCMLLSRKRMEKEDLNPDNMIKVEDVCELVLLPFRVSANSVPQEVVLDVMKDPTEM